MGVSFMVLNGPHGWLFTAFGFRLRGKYEVYSLQHHFCLWVAPCVFWHDDSEFVMKWTSLFDRSSTVLATHTPGTNRSGGSSLSLYCCSGTRQRNFLLTWTSCLDRGSTVLATDRGWRKSSPTLDCCSGTYASDPL